MSTKTTTYLIESWSGRTMRARQHYVCALCGGTIPSGTIYVRDVVRHSPIKGDGYRSNVHTHLNCKAPWWQPDGLAPRLRSVGRLPHRVPTSTEVDLEVPFQKPVLAVSASDIGTFTWKMPPGLETRLGRCPSEARKLSALSELEDSLSLVLAAFIKAAGNQRRARELSLQLGAITQSL
ncbi:MAG: hypothetical protein ACK4SL_00845 [Candidatus Paceibacteria bacterium]